MVWNFLMHSEIFCPYGIFPCPCNFPMLVEILCGYSSIPFLWNFSMFIKFFHAYETYSTFQCLWNFSKFEVSSLFPNWSFQCYWKSASLWKFLILIVFFDVGETFPWSWEISILLKLFHSCVTFKYETFPYLCNF